MKICIVSYIYPCGDGIYGIFIHEQAEEFVKSGHEVHVITPGKGDEIMGGVNIHRIDSDGINFSIRCFLRIIRLDKEVNLDVVNGHFTGLLTYLAYVAAEKIKKPFVLTAYGMGLLPESAGFFSKRLLRKSKKIICISAGTAELVKYFTDSSKIAIINPGINPSKLKPTKTAGAFKKEKNLDNKTILLSAGDLIERRGIDTILKALPPVMEEFPDLVYLVIGRGPKRADYEKLAKELGIEKRVHFLGFVTNEELVNYFACCDVFALMSRTIKETGSFDGFGISQVEASYFGKPVIAGNSGGCPDAVLDRKTGFLVEPLDVEALTEKLLQLFRDANLRVRLGREGKKHAISLSWPNLAKKTIGVYNEIISNQKNLR